MPELPEVVSLHTESSTAATYDNHPITTVNDHVVRISTMTHPYHWHRHPDSDETFLVIEGAIEIEFASGTVRLEKNELLTVPKGVVHRTRPVGERSVNVTFESASSTSESVVVP